MDRGTLSKRGNYYQVTCLANGKQYRKSTRESDLESAKVVGQQMIDALVGIKRRTETSRSSYPDDNGSWADIMQAGQENCGSWLRDMYQRAKDRAKKRGREFKLTFDELVCMAHSTQGFCSVSGLAFSWDRPNSCNAPPFAPSLDRIDASLGYTILNCRLVCYSVNVSLSDWGSDVLVEMCRGVVNQNEKEPYRA